MEDMNLKERIRERLAALEPRLLQSGYRREAAVLMPIFLRRREPHFLLTLRTDEVRTHKGQISFPGGMRLEEENLRTTALRETCEEVGIRKENIEVLGRFHDYLSINDYRVAPFAGWLEDSFTPVAESNEVAEILEVPFSLFADPRNLTIERMPRFGRMIDVYFYRFGRYRIWGLTARIIKEFLETLLLIR